MISFKIFTKASADALVREVAAAMPDADLDLLRDSISIMLMDGDETEYATSYFGGCLLIRIFDGEYSFAYPIGLHDSADPMAAVEEIRLYAIKEEIPLVFCDVPSEELGDLIPKFRHLTVDATDPDGECYTVRVMSEAALLDELPTVKGRGFVRLTPITEADDESYFALCTDIDTNKYWGYDYREDEPDPEKDYFRENSEMEFARGSAISLAVRVKGQFVGEATLYAFDLLGGCECAVRLLPDFRGRGYATEALKLLKRLATNMDIVYLMATVDKENIASQRMTEKCLDEIGRTDSKVKYRSKL